ncbi:hypothetical protein BTA51_17500 [Hahella sp. CCB-MM4]|uniref:cupin domain-containing protein n=1 Tax=Hahella sp. (strain CCB-MM4) TaxID=1926491 RepID=UPI000B9C1254|nr:cupin domain-containing protein [Hahella sp. CCB-MM4]OZG72150.1 hypothetical protein BTA51_17500 [Hahella sp. CCB-MM4]
MATNTLPLPEELPRNARSLLRQLKLEPHPEGGYYRRIFTSTTSIDTDSGRRPTATIIYYLLPRGAYSQWHRLRNEEVWIFVEGDPISIHRIEGDGSLHTDLLGAETSLTRQAIVPGGQWLAAEPVDHSRLGYTLVCCLMTPGFDYSDFELAEKGVLSLQYPRLSSLIERLIR